MSNPTAEQGFAFVPGALVWVHTDGWAGRRKRAGVLLKINPKRSRVRIEGILTALVPNHAITKRYPLEDL